MKLMGNRLLISPLPVKRESEGRIILPQESVGDKKLFWRVDQVGDGAPLPKSRKKIRPTGLRASEYRIGEIVITPLHFSHFTFEDGTERKIVDCEHIIGKLEEA